MSKLGLHNQVIEQRIEQEMNVRRLIYRLTRKLKKQMRRYRHRYRHSMGTQVFFVVAVTLVCILAAELSPYGRMRVWHRHLTHQEVVNKGVIRDVNEKDLTQTRGQFLTYYRHITFGASDPDDVDRTAPMVAFTFDDGPNPEYTKRILDVLNANYSHATFFVVGNNAESYPETLQNILSSGSEIGNHTYHHANLTKADDDTIEKEISDVNRAVKNATGEKATLIRPPYGAYNDKVMALLTEPVVLWDLDTEDWSSRNAQDIAEKVLSTVKDGDIVLMHDIYESTAEAVEIMVPKLKEMGYQIVSVSQMAQYKGRTLELGKAYGEIDALSGQ